MRNASRTLRALLLSILAGAMLIGASISLAGPSVAAPAQALRVPCGRPNYAPCPPRKKITVYPRIVHRGHRIFIVVQHYPAFTPVTVHLAGHGRYILLASTRTGRLGNAFLAPRIPKGIPTGYYTLYVQVGSVTEAYTIHVLR